MTRFLDSNIFIYAFYKPGRQLTALDKKMKDLSKKIIADVGEGRESVITTVVHLSEVANILKYALSNNQVRDIVNGILVLENVEVLSVEKKEYFVANELGRELEMDSNDALALQVMKSKSLREIYSFDRAFEKIEEIRKIPAL